MLPVLDRVMVLPDPRGQLRLVLPGVSRVPFATGQQERCVACEAAGVTRQGVSRDGPGSDPLCLACWGRRQRRPHRLTPEESGWLAELAERLACEVCRPDAPAPVADVPAEAVRERRLRRRRRRRSHDRGRQRPATVRRTGCWRCGDAAWLASVRAVHTADQEAAAVEAGRVDELAAEHRAAVRVVERARRRLAVVRAWQDRVAGVVAALPTLTKTGARGRLELRRGPAGRARPVWLIADVLARMAADRTARGLSGRGRRSQQPLVVGVMAVAADPAAGRRSMAGLAPTAAYAGVSVKTVSSAWAMTQRLGATTLVEAGRTCSLAEREETGLHRRRSVYDFAPLHTSPFDPVSFLGEAAAVVAELLARAGRLVDAHQAVVDAAGRRAAAAQAAWLDAQAVVAEREAEDLAVRASLAVPADPTRTMQAAAAAAWSDEAFVAFQAALAVRARASRAAVPPADPQAVVNAERAARAGRAAQVAAVDAAFEQANRMANFYHPPRRGSGKKSCSGFRGLFFSAQSTSLVAGGRRPDGRGEGHTGGASRPASTRKGALPRTPEGVRGGLPARSRRSEAMWWAKPLARGLVQEWEFLARFVDDADDGRRGGGAVARERGLRLAMIAATLVPRLGPDWSAGDVVRLVERYGLAERYGVRRLIAPGDAHSPLRYLATVLDRALSDPHAVVPWPSPVHRAARAAVEAAEAAQRRAASAQLREGFDDRQAAMVTGPARTAAAAAVRAAIRRPTLPGRRPAVPGPR